jgi:hypothetical protein
VHADPLERGVAVAHHVHRVRVTAQPLGHRVGEQRLVLHHQDAHPPRVTARAFPRR